MISVSNAKDHYLLSL